MDIHYIEEKTTALKEQAAPLLEAVKKTETLIKDLTDKIDGMKIDKQQSDIDATLESMAKERDARALLQELNQLLATQKQALNDFWNNEETNYSIKEAANHSIKGLSTTEAGFLSGLIDNGLKKKLKAYDKEVKATHAKALELSEYLRENNYDMLVGNALHPLAEDTNFYYFQIAQLITSTFQHELMEYLLDEQLITNYPAYYNPRR